MQGAGLTVCRLAEPQGVQAALGLGSGLLGFGVPYFNTFFLKEPL